MEMIHARQFKAHGVDSGLWTEIEGKSNILLKWKCSLAQLRLTGSLHLKAYLFTIFSLK